ncbi:hypothetical protein [Streptomyces sp. NPDC051572]
MTHSTKRHRGLVVPGRLHCDSQHGEKVRLLAQGELVLVYPGLPLLAIA